MSNSNFVPTPKLRFVERDGAKILQQYFSEDVPNYMRNNSAGEWRDVETTQEISAISHVHKSPLSDAAEPISD
jgi:hypothetical protein